MFPLVPSSVPGERQNDRVKDDLNLAPRVPVDSVIVQEVDAPQGSAEAALAMIGEKRQDAVGEKGLAIARQVAGDEDCAEAAVREQDRRFGITKQRIVAGTELGLHQDIERPFDITSLGELSAPDFQFEAAHLVGQTHIARGPGGRNSKEVVESRRLCPLAATVSPVEVVADRRGRKVHSPDAERAPDDFRTQKTFLTFVLPGLGHIADRRKVDLLLTKAIGPDDADLGGCRCGEARRELYLVSRREKPAKVRR